MSEVVGEGAPVVEAPVEAPVVEEAAPKRERAPKIETMQDAFKAAKRELAAKGDPAEQKEAPKVDKPVVVEEEKASEPPPTPALEAPKRWTPERKELFAKQSPEIQADMIALGKEWETGYSKKFNDLAEERKFAEAIKKEFTPELRDQMARAGLDEIGSVKSLLAMQQSYMADPVKHIKGLIKHSGINPESLFGPDATPQEHPLEREIKELKAMVLAEKQSKEAASHESAILDFASATDDTGSLAYPYIERVAEEMATIISSDTRLRAMTTAEKLKTAYDIAVYTNPELRAEIVAAEAQKRLAAMQPPQQVNHGRAWEAATVKSSTPGSHAASVEVTDLRSAHAAARRELGRR